ncbi:MULTISPECIES: hypothetical protein [Streptomyces]|uniref:hypothetical protein n=1 Tax=Streptomyces TaxID=1883 RepID=UPI00345BD289
MAQLVAAVGVVTVLHPLLLPLLVLAVLPRAWGAVRAARTEHAAHHCSVSDRRLRQTFRDHITDRNTAPEVRAGTMAPYLTDQYRVISTRLEAEQSAAARQAQRLDPYLSHARRPFAAQHPHPPGPQRRRPHRL